jgi:NAD-dependent deacetylase
VALARLEAALKKVQEKKGAAEPEYFLVTQNVDDLHEKGGSQQVCHTHGSMLLAKCDACDHKFDWLNDLTPQDLCPSCQAKGQIRPDVVWFEEMPYHLELIEKNLLKAHLFVSIGTSGAVYPAASYLRLAKSNGAQALEINLAPTEAAGLYDRGLYGPASETVPNWVNEVIESLAL